MFGTLDFLNYIDPVARYNIKTTTDLFEMFLFMILKLKTIFFLFIFRTKKFL
nr:MAG TPA: hypothetical protein [Caudoviricetes sp.]